MMILRSLGFLRSSRQKLNEQMDLQITSMADIFTILLVFLLKTYSATSIGVNIASDVSLPSATTGTAPVEVLKLEISSQAVTIDGHPSALLDQFRFARADLDSSGASRALLKDLARERKRQLEIARQNADVQPDARLLVLADRKAPYGTIRAALRSAAANGYTDYKLVVVGAN